MESSSSTKNDATKLRLLSGDRRWLGCRLSVFHQGESTSHLLQYSLPPYHANSRQHPTRRKGTKCENILKTNVWRPGAMTAREFPWLSARLLPDLIPEIQ